jgi:hypothetical protein
MLELSLRAGAPFLGIAVHLLVLKTSPRRYPFMLTHSYGSAV